MNDAVLIPTQREEMFEGAGAVQLFARSWRPSGAVRSVFVIVHGFKAHSGRYSAVAEELVQNGLAVYAMDLRGHGKSEGERYWVDSFDDYVADLENFMAIVRTREPGIPVFLFGHSAGGVVASLYAARHQHELAGLISEDFAFELPPPEFALAIIKGLSHIVPHAHVLNIPDAAFSRDPAVVESMRTDPLIVHTPGPSQTLAAMVRADADLKQRIPDISLPLLIIHGTADTAVKPHGSQRFFDDVASRDKTLKLYDGFLHDPLHDLGREQVMADLVTWVTDRMTREAA
jgi:alpha-beta hydrolase superfamily lysophospholipase